MEIKILREYFSGIPITRIVKRYGIKPQQVELMAIAYRSDFDTFNTKKLETTNSIGTEEVLLLKNRIMFLEEELKISHIKIEGLNKIIYKLKEEYSIDLLNIAEAEPLLISKKKSK